MQRPCVTHGLCTRLAIVIAVGALAAACSAESVDLDVTTSELVIEDPTTTTTEPPPTTSTSLGGPTTTLEQGPGPVAPGVATVIPVRPIRLADDDGARQAAITPEQIVAWLNRANEVFAPARFGFSYDPAAGIDQIQDSDLNGWTEDSRWFSRLMRGNETAAGYPGELVVMIARGPDGDSVDSFGSPHTDFVIVGEWEEETLCDEPDLEVLAHGMGRHFALPTTFSTTYPTVEAAANALANADQDRSAFDGDGFGDTPPDPAVYAEHQCSGEETVTIGGLEFDLPRENIMSLYQERNSLTLQQVDRARWMLELRRSNEMLSPTNTRTQGSVEAEDTLTGTQGSCGLPFIQSMEPWIGTQWVDRDQLLAPSEDGCSLEFTLPVENAGAHEVVFLGTRAPDYGAVQISIDGETVHFEDLYAPTLLASGPVVLGEANLEPPTATVTVEVVGSNAQSSGSSVGIDGFALRPPSG